MYAVFADHIFEGLYRSRAAAEKLVAELNEYPIKWRQAPIIQQCNENSDFDEYYGFSCRTEAVRAIMWHHFGRRKITTN